MPRRRAEGIIRFRVSNELLAKLEAAAKTSRRTVSAEVNYRLERSFEDPVIIDTIKNTVQSEIRWIAGVLKEGGKQ
jgi:hypothetical protein